MPWKGLPRPDHLASSTYSHTRKQRTFVRAYLRQIDHVNPCLPTASNDLQPARDASSQLALFDRADLRWWGPLRPISLLGDDLLRSYRRSGHASLPTVDLDAFWGLIRMPVVTPAEGLALVVAYLVQDDSRDGRTLQRLVDEITRFVSTLDVEGLTEISAITPDVVSRFLSGATTRGEGTYGRPSPTTISHRRTAVREFYAIGRTLGFAAGDPTLDLEVPPRPTRASRPLTESELRTVRAVAGGQFISARNPALVALAQAGATNGEIATVRISDVSLDNGTVRLAGSRRTNPRVNHLDTWAIESIHQRIAFIGNVQPNHPLVVLPGTEADVAAASVSNALTEVLQYAGLASERRVKPDSIRAGAARRIHIETGHIEDVVRFLGLRSLDAAASLIGYDWSSITTRTAMD